MSRFVKCKSQFIAKYNYKDFVLLSPQRVAISGAIIYIYIEDSNPDSLDPESGIQPPSHGASTIVKELLDLQIYWFTLTQGSYSNKIPVYSSIFQDR